MVSQLRVKLRYQLHGATKPPFQMRRQKLSSLLGSALTRRDYYQLQLSAQWNSHQAEPGYYPASA